MRRVGRSPTRASMATATIALRASLGDFLMLARICATLALIRRSPGATFVRSSHCVTGCAGGWAYLPTAQIEDLSAAPLLRRHLTNRKEYNNEALLYPGRVLTLAAYRVARGRINRRSRAGRSQGQEDQERRRLPRGQSQGTSADNRSRQWTDADRRTRY